MIVTKPFSRQFARLAKNQTRRPALFLDRDGTMIEEVPYLDHPDAVRLLPTVAETLCVANAAGYLVVMVTNQAGIGRGLFTWETVIEIHQRIASELFGFGASLDAEYICPHHPEARFPEFRVECDCRKPRPGMLLLAAQQMQIDLDSSFMIGDRLTDMAAGANAGCATVLVRTGLGRQQDLRQLKPEIHQCLGVKDDLHSAFQMCLQSLEARRFDEKLKGWDQPGDKRF